MTINFEIIKPTDTGNAKGTVHKNGRLGLNKAASVMLDLENNRLFKIARNRDDKSDNNLYLIRAEENDEAAIRTKKAGDYYSLNLRSIFDTLGIEFESRRVIFDISPMTEYAHKVYKLKKRELKKKKVKA